MEPQHIEANELLAELSQMDPRLVELAAYRVANRHLAARIQALETAPVTYVPAE